MGRLAGLTYRDITRKLRAAGFVFDRQAKGSHEIWMHPITRRRTTVANHPGTIPEGTVRALVRGAGLAVEEFLAL
jgi:predicted RNA binding protein YcfA (HicA-like mRNA interferase family)